MYNLKKLILIPCITFSPIFCMSSTDQDNQEAKDTKIITCIQIITNFDIIINGASRNYLSIPDTNMIIRGYLFDQNSITNGNAMRPIIHGQLSLPRPSPQTIIQIVINRNNNNNLRNFLLSLIDTYNIVISDNERRDLQGASSAALCSPCGIH